MALKTYILAPNFTLEPDGPIRIGTIIADPYRPTKPLSVPLTSPTTVTHVDFEYSLSQDNSKSLSGSVWAQFLQTARANIGGAVSKAALQEYAMDSLETVRIKADPTDEEAAERVKDPKVHAAIRAGLTGAAPVYMITGLKVAKGFRLNKSVTSTHEANIGANVPITAEVGAGADIAASIANTVSESSRSGSDIIFAYQLHLIARKGWLHKRVGVDVFVPKSALLNKEKKAELEEEEEKVMAQSATESALLEIAEENEDDSVRSLEALDGEEACICIAFEEV
ncbi:hypothetical protein BGZ63DRAFT_404793 [Mariannaea sp. PMI_226]|nr:hypothetical protein BGZ63DRAFT_404793 [Mariannaea sp. PMI_226]